MEGRESSKGARKKQRCPSCRRGIRVTATDFPNLVSDDYQTVTPIYGSAIGPAIDAGLSTGWFVVAAAFGIDPLKPRRVVTESPGDGVAALRQTAACNNLLWLFGHAARTALVPRPRQPNHCRGHFIPARSARMLLEILAVIGLFAIVYVLTQWLMGTIN